MSVDTVNYALTTVRMQILRDPASYSEMGSAKLLSMCDVLRGDLMGEQILWFDQHVNDYLANEPDAADYLLEELFYQLDITDREELTAILCSL